MITHKNGDIFTTELHAIGHGVNCRGVMGSGIAVAVKNKYPDVYKAYKDHCEHVGMSGGDLLVVQSQVDEKYIFNLASQEDTGANASYDWLRESVHKALQFCEDQGLPSLALPRIGSRIGGLEWENVLAILEEESNKFPQIELELWSYEELPEEYWKSPENRKIYRENAK